MCVVIFYNMNISEEIFTYGYRYSSYRFYWRNSKLIKILNKYHKKKIVNLFNLFFKALFVRTKELSLKKVKLELNELERFRDILTFIQSKQMSWCKCLHCYKKKTLIQGYTETDENEDCLACQSEI